MTHTNLVLLGKRIAEARQQRKLSQDRLSELCSISTHHISELERGKTNPSFQVLQKISEALSVSVVSLLDFNHHAEREKLEKEIAEILSQLPDDKFRTLYRIITCFCE